MFILRSRLKCRLRDVDGRGARRCIDDPFQPPRRLAPSAPPPLRRRRRQRDDPAPDLAPRRREFRRPTRLRRPHVHAGDRPAGASFAPRYAGFGLSGAAATAQPLVNLAAFETRLVRNFSSSNERPARPTPAPTRDGRGPPQPLRFDARRRRVLRRRPLSQTEARGHSS